MSCVVFLLFCQHCHQLVTFSNLAQGFSRDFTVTEYIAAWSSYQATVGLPQYETQYYGPALGAACLWKFSYRLLKLTFILTVTYTGIDVRLAVFNAHLIFNHQLSNNQQRRHGLQVIKLALSH